MLKIVPRKFKFERRCGRVLKNKEKERGNKVTSVFMHKVIVFRRSHYYRILKPLLPEPSSTQSPQSTPSPPPQIVSPSAVSESHHNHDNAAK
jgi:hypothetical protein